MVGAFYTHEHNRWLQSIVANDPTTGAILGHWLDENWHVDYAEYAAFTDVTLHFTDQFDIQIGGRASNISQNYSEVDTGPFVTLFEGAQSPLYSPEVKVDASPVTYMFTPRFKFSPDLMAYLTLSSGYRPGGPNATASPFGLPTSFKPDKTQNYELGMKGDALGHTLSFDASLYYINWKDIQIGFVAPNEFAYNANGSQAKSEGLEVSVATRPLAGMTIKSWMALNDAELTRPFPPASALYGASGDRLPTSSRFSGNLSLDQEFPLVGATTGFAGASLSYVGDRKGNFTAAPPAIAPRQDYPGYAQIDLRAGAKYESWMTNLYVTNVADKRGLIYGGAGTVLPNTFTYITPRTVGISLSKTF